MFAALYPEKCAESDEEAKKAAVSAALRTASERERELNAEHAKKYKEERGMPGGAIAASDAPPTMARSLLYSSYVCGKSGPQILGHSAAEYASGWFSRRSATPMSCEGPSVQMIFECAGNPAASSCSDDAVAEALRLEREFIAAH